MEEKWNFHQLQTMAGNERARAAGKLTWAIQTEQKGGNNREKLFFTMQNCRPVAAGFSCIKIHNASDYFHVTKSNSRELYTWLNDEWGEGSGRCSAETRLMQY